MTTHVYLGESCCNASVSSQLCLLHLHVSAGHSPLLFLSSPEKAVDTKKRAQNEAEVDRKVPRFTSRMENPNL